MFRNKRLEYKTPFFIFFFFSSRIYIYWILEFRHEYLSEHVERNCGIASNRLFLKENDLVLINVANVVILARIYINKSKTRLHRDEILWYCRMSARATRTIVRHGNAFRHSLGIIHQVFTKIVRVLSRCRRSRCIYGGEFPRNRVESPVHL